MGESTTQGVKVFISHAHQDRALALKLSNALKQGGSKRRGREREGIECFVYEEDIPFGQPAMMKRIREDLQESDHVLVILTPDAQRSVGVSRELGLAATLNASRRHRPSIIGIRPKSSGRNQMVPPKRISSIRLRDFRTGRLLDRRHNFADPRFFDFETDPIDDLINQLALTVTFIKSTEGRDGQLLTKSFDCYRQIFPPIERDAPEHIQTWIDEARVGATQGYPWRELYAVLHTGSQAVGMAYLSVHVKSHWCFGNYVAILPHYRRFNRAEFLFKAIRSKLSEIDPECKGILFEVEPIERKLPVLRDLAALVRTSREVREQLRRICRVVLLYDTQHASALVGPKGALLPYSQPAMKRPLGPQNEIPLILRAFLFKKVMARDAIDFIYDDLYGDAYGGAGSVEIPGYRAYVKRVKAKVISRLNGAHFAPWRAPDRYKRLIRRALGQHLERYFAL